MTRGSRRTERPRWRVTSRGQIPPGDLQPAHEAARRLNRAQCVDEARAAQLDLRAALDALRARGCDVWAVCS